MEFIIIPQLVLVFSLAGILLILGRNFSKFKEVSAEEKYDGSLEELEEVTARVKGEEKKFKYLFRRMAKRISLRAIQERYKRFLDLIHIKLEKILRKIRINFLRLDNKFVALIEKLRKSKNEKEIQIKSVESSVDRIGEFEIEKLPIIKKTNKVKKSESKSEKDNGKRSGKKTKKLSKKEEEYLKLISNDPKNMDAYWKLGILYSRKKNYKDALDCFKEIIKIKPNYEKARKKIKIISDKLKRE